MEWIEEETTAANKDGKVQFWCCPSTHMVVLPSTHVEWCCPSTQMEWCCPSTQMEWCCPSTQMEWCCPSTKMEWCYPNTHMVVLPQHPVVLTYPSAGFAPTDTVCCIGTLIQFLALVTMASASMAPNPNWWLTLSPAWLVDHVQSPEEVRC